MAIYRANVNHLTIRVKLIHFMTFSCCNTASIWPQTDYDWVHDYFWIEMVWRLFVKTINRFEALCISMWLLRIGFFEGFFSFFCVSRLPPFSSFPFISLSPTLSRPSIMIHSHTSKPSLSLFAQRSTTNKYVHRKSTEWPEGTSTSTHRVTEGKGYSQMARCLSMDMVRPRNHQSHGAQDHYSGYLYSTIHRLGMEWRSAPKRFTSHWFLISLFSPDVDIPFIRFRCKWKI